MLAYAPIIQALSGLMSVVGYSGDEQLVGELQAPWSDVVAALHAALATVAALRHRNLTGQGQFIEVSQLEATTSMLGEALLGYQVTGAVPEPRGNYDAAYAPHNNYPCSDPSQWVAIAVGGDAEWATFCAALGNPDWASEARFASHAGRLEHLAELDDRVSRWTSERTAWEVTELLQGYGIAAMPVMNIEDQFVDPHLQERQAFVEVEHPHVGIEWLYGMPWLLGGTPGSVRTPAPTIGQHNDYVLGELLGLPSAELERLRKTQAIY